MKISIYFKIAMSVTHLPSPRCLVCLCVRVCVSSNRGNLEISLCVHTYIHIFKHICCPFHRILLLQIGCENLQNTFKGRVDRSIKEKK